MLQHAVNLRKAEFYAPVLSVFSQIASKKILANQESLNKVKDLLKHLAKNVKASWEDLSKIEANQVKEFLAEKAALEKEIKELEALEKKQLAHIAAMNVCIGTQQGIIAAANSKIERNSDLLKSSTKMCSEFVATYKADTTKRNNELDLVQKIREIVMKRYQAIAKQVVARGMKETSEFKKYVNKTAYSPPEAYLRAKGIFNKKGAAQAGFKKNEKLAAVDLE